MKSSVDDRSLPCEERICSRASKRLMRTGMLSPATDPEKPASELLAAGDADGGLLSSSGEHGRDAAALHSPSFDAQLAAETCFRCFGFSVVRRPSSTCAGASRSSAGIRSLAASPAAPPARALPVFPSALLLPGALGLRAVEGVFALAVVVRGVGRRGFPTWIAADVCGSLPAMHFPSTAADCPNNRAERCPSPRFRIFLTPPPTPGFTTPGERDPFLTSLPVARPGASSSTPTAVFRVPLPFWRSEFGRRAPVFVLVRGAGFASFLFSQIKFCSASLKWVPTEDRLELHVAWRWSLLGGFSRSSRSSTSFSRFSSTSESNAHPTASAAPPLAGGA
eukprot:CAMPEP_0179006770 /NCGR_PEP_ID=MMETSP0795-20121207/14750_1 /TAXON_ID=88552 /ORGANISM="Amoebophrya sp., Strain Ameob2" /LENGTH=335 /DNA_ID=CAMNT_0020701591 /DNA_START=461 /DNA_END=1469 /DNA_ORIENTATION=+